MIFRKGRRGDMNLAKRIVASACGLAVVSTIGLTGCGTAEPIYTERKTKTNNPVQSRRLGEAKKTDSVFGEGGLSGMLGGGDTKQGGASGVAVNLYLWRATLETISFMPLSSTDPFGGVIITDWYILPESPNERFKVNVYIQDVALRADGVKVSVFREVKQADGIWASALVDAETATGLEDSILTRARELRMSTANQP